MVRPILPKDENTVSSTPDSAPEYKSSKRRCVSSACIPCRKRKSKCDGGTPSCSTCTAVYHTECAYDIDSDHRRKGALKRDIESLRERNGALGVIVASIRSLPESDVADIVSHIRVDDDLDALAESLRRSVNLPRQSDSQTLEADAFSIERKPALGNTSDVRQYGHTSCLGLVTEDQDMSPWSPIVPVAPLGLSWTSVTNDVEFINHLMNLYFAWPHPFYQLFSRECFLFDMQKGRTKYCSALLVNAILACSCHFSDRIAARAVPDDPRSAGDHFFAEAKRILNEYETPDLTTVQALGVMSVREASYGRDSSGYQYAGRCLRMALELGLHLSITTAENPSISPSQTEVRRITFWGCFNLDTLWSVCVGRIPQLPRTAIDLDKPTVVKALDSKPWIPYTDTSIGDSQLVGQPSHTHEYLKQYSLLSELTSDANFMFYAPRERLHSRKLLDCYTKYQKWLMALPHCLRLKNTTLSYVLELHIYYHTCVLHLFRPFVKLNLKNSNVCPRDVCTSSANRVSDLVNTLRGLYGLRRVSLVITHCLLTSAFIHLLNLPSETASSYLVQNLLDLDEMAQSHYHAARCVRIVCGFAKKSGIALPEEVSQSTRIRSLSSDSSLSSPVAPTHFAATIPHDRFVGSSSSRGMAPNAVNDTRRPSVSDFFMTDNDSWHRQRAGSHPPPQPTEQFFWTPWAGGKGIPLQPPQFGSPMDLNSMLDGTAIEQFERDGFRMSETQPQDHQQNTMSVYDEWPRH